MSTRFGDFLDIEKQSSHFFDVETLESALIEVEFSQLYKYVSVSGSFSNDCEFRINEKAWERLRRKEGLTISLMNVNGANPEISRSSYTLGDLSGSYSIRATSSYSTLVIGRCYGTFEFRMHRSPRLTIGDGTTSISTRIAVFGHEVTIGRDCMFSEDIFIQSHDAHEIFDVKTRAMLRSGTRNLQIGQHVWLGRRCMLMPGVSIGDGAIVGAGSLVTKHVPSMSLAVGVPARIQREGVTWSRSYGEIDGAALAFLEYIERSKAN